MPLPKIMVAPNGARRTKQDHPNLPINVAEIVATAKACHDAGAGGVHLHVRDEQGLHVLDAGLYNEALSELKESVVDMQLQITTEAVGRYSPSQQRDVVKKVHPESVSISISEMFADVDSKAVFQFYRWCQEADIEVQHILYGVEDLELLSKLLSSGELLDETPQLLFVLGRYARNQESMPEDLLPFMHWLSSMKDGVDWAVCAFGRGETDCLVAGHKLGGKLRVGFENSLWNSDGSMASSNAERVREIYELTAKVE